MRLPILTLLAMLASAGCATGAGSPSNPAGAVHPAAKPGTLPPPPTEAPRPRAVSGPETVGATELGALKVTRATVLRQEPTAASQRFGALKEGDLVLRLDARGPWYRVWVPSVALSGWIEKGSAEPGKAEAAVAAEPVPVTELATVTVAKGGARLRSGPSAKAGVIRALEKGEPLRILRQEGPWVKVFDPATKGPGYVSVQLVERAR